MTRLGLPPLPRLGDERGFTLVELLMTMVIGLIVLGAGTLTAIGAGRHNNEVQARTTANQTGRLAMERIERLLRSQTCYGTGTSSLTSATANSLTFYADLGGGNTPTLHTITLNATAGTLTDAASPAASPSAIKTETLATKAALSPTGSPFRYYKYPTTVPATGPYTPSQELVPAASLSATDLGDVARIDIDFVVGGGLVKSPSIRAQMTDQVFLRLADPNRADPSPTCN